MKQKLLIAILLISGIAPAFAQKGDLFVGANGGYLTGYKEFIFGTRVGYHIIDPLELNFNFWTNPFITEKDPIDAKNDVKVQFYSHNLDLNYYILQGDTWGMAPVLGVEFNNIRYNYNNRTPEIKTSENYWGMNMGWHMRYNITDNIKLNGGWKYTWGQSGNNYHVFYAGIGYTFNLE